MSREARDWAWKVADLTMGERVVLLYLAERARKGGLAWPKLGTIATDCHIDRTAVWRAIKGLIADGHITDEGPGETPDGGASDHRYQLNLKGDALQIATPVSAGSVTNRNAPRDNSQQDALQIATPMLQIATPLNKVIEPSLNRQPKPSIEPSGNGARRKKPPRVETWGSYETEEGFIQAVIVEFPSLGERWVRDKVAKILDHQARMKYTHMHLYVGDWLREDAAKAIKAQGGQRNGASQRHSEPDRLRPAIPDYDGPGPRFPGFAKT